MKEWTIRETGNIWVHKTQDEDNQNKNTTQYVYNNTIHKTKTTKTKTQHNMCITTSYTRRRQPKQKHNTICV